jgi:NhaP-type Na+/H+ or K+/H+ antiporter
VQISKANETRADAALAGAYMIQEVQGFNEQLERIAEVAIVLVVGAMLSYTYLHSGAVWFVLLLFWSCVPYRCGLACSARAYRAISGS